MHGLDMAKRLLGKLLVHVIDTHLHEGQANFSILAGKITETEYYDGQKDEACHAFHGKSKRNEVMFWEAGHLYVYLIYGIHYCANIVTDTAGIGSAVLIRGIEPVIGVGQMLENRGIKKGDSHFLKNPGKGTDGPGKLTQAMGIRDIHNGLNLKSGNIFVCHHEEIHDDQINAGLRIGISKAKDLPWRFTIKK